MKQTENTNKINKLYNLMPVSAGVIASVLFALSPSQTVIANEKDSEKNILEFESLHAQVHSFLSELENQNDDEDENESKENNEVVSDKSTLPLVAEYDEMTAIKNILLNAIKNAENDEYAAELSAADLTIPELEEILNEIVIKLANEEQVSDHTLDELEGLTDTETPINPEDLEVTEEPKEIEEIGESEDLGEIEESGELEDPTVEEDSAVIISPNEADTMEPNEVIEDAAPTITANTVSTASIVNTTSSNEVKTIVHTVRAGETLNGIANRYQVTVNQIISLNGILNPNLIRVGQRLTIQTNQPGQSELEDISENLTNSEFINVVGNHAQQVAADHNLYASVMIAQAALESGFGGSSLSSAPNYNLFGIKGSYNGNSVSMRTREYYNGWIYVYADFKKYPSYAESLLDNARLLRNGLSWDRNYYLGTWRENTNSYLDATSWLEGRYATDPTYANKLNNIISRYNLTQFDVPFDESIVENPPTEDEKDVKPSTGDKDSVVTDTYIVKRGDTLSHIAVRHNTSVSELKRLNNLTSDIIYVGQHLKLNSTAKPVSPSSGSSNSSSAIPKNNAGKVHTVKTGETLSGIARQYNISVSNLVNWNNLSNAHLIRINQQLIVSSSKQSSTSNSTGQSSNGRTRTYRVSRGDTLSHIAVRFNTTVSNLKAKNNLNSDLIFVGQVLSV